MTIKSLYSKIEQLKESAEELVETLEERRDAVEEKALFGDRDMTEKEQERYEKYDDQAIDVQLVVDDLGNALVEIEEWTL